MNRVKGVLRGVGLAVGAAVASIASMAPVAHAQFSGDLVPKITAAETDVTAIGGAVLGALVLILVFGLVKRAMGK